MLERSPKKIPSLIRLFPAGCIVGLARSVILNNSQVMENGEASTLSNVLKNPDAVTMYSNQVGGHGILIKPKDSKYILKHAQEMEYHFYNDCMPLTCSALQPFTPIYYGQVELDATSVSKCSSDGRSSLACVKYLMMEDLAYGMTKPCILDLKMGLKQRSVRKYSDMKVSSKLLKSLNTTSHKLGFRLGGAQLHKSSDGVAFYNKYFGRQLDEQGIYKVLESFFSSMEGGEPNSSKILIADFLNRLHELEETIETLDGFRFWSGSLLFLFDAVDPANSSVLKMIDFANFTLIDPSYGPDKEYLYGLNCLIEFLEGLLDDQPDVTVVMETILNSIGTPPDPRSQDEELAVQVAKFKDHIATTES